MQAQSETIEIFIQQSNIRTRNICNPQWAIFNMSLVLKSSIFFDNQNPIGTGFLIFGTQVSPRSFLVNCFHRKLKIFTPVFISAPELLDRALNINHY